MLRFAEVSVAKTGRESQPHYAEGLSFRSFSEGGWYPRQDLNLQSFP